MDYIPNTNPAGNTSITSIGDMLGIAINVLMGSVFALGFVSIAVGFIQLITSEGDPKATGKGFTTIKWGIIAVLLAFFVIIIKTIVFRTTGVSGINDIPSNF